MYYAVAPIAKLKQQVDQLKEFYIRKLEQFISQHKGHKAIYMLLVNAVKDFNQIEILNKDCLQIGVVGEIYVKYNNFANQQSIDWLVDQGIEQVILPKSIGNYNVLFNNYNRIWLYDNLNYS